MCHAAPARSWLGATDQFFDRNNQAGYRRLEHLSVSTGLGAVSAVFRGRPRRATSWSGAPTWGQLASHARMQRTAGGPLRQTHKQRDRKMILQDAFDLFRRLGVHSEMISRPEFSAAYYGLARRFHPDVNPATHELMANINAARTTILQSYRRSS